MPPSQPLVVFLRKCIRGLATASCGKMSSSSAISSGVRVLVRIRPLLPSLSETGRPVSHLQPDAGDGRSVSLQLNNTLHQYTFDSVMPPAATQSDVFYSGGIDSMLDCVAAGYSATIFAYGQTGSGKTHTMDGVGASTGSNSGSGGGVGGATAAANQGGNHGVSEASGVTIRSIYALYDKLASDPNNILGNNSNNPSSGQDPQQQPQYGVSVTCSFVQIYQEHVYDLLSTSLSISSSSSSSSSANTMGEAGGPNSNGSLKVRWAQGRDFYVDGLTSSTCSTPQQAIACFLAGTKRRVVAQHRLNTESSRSHSLFTLTVTKTPVNGNGNGNSNTAAAAVIAPGSVARHLTLQLRQYISSKKFCALKVLYLGLDFLLFQSAAI